VRHWLVFTFLVVVTNPYQGKGIDWGEEESQLYEYKKDYSINVYGPEPDNSPKETSFTEQETKRFIRKIDSIINTDYSSFVFER
jgi:hypothetical protein